MKSSNRKLKKEAAPVITLVAEPTREIASGLSRQIKRQTKRSIAKALTRRDLIAPVTPGTPEFVPGLSVATHTRDLVEAKKLSSVDTDVIYRWRTRYMEGGRVIEALVDAPRGGAGKFRGALADPVVRSVILHTARELLRTSGNPDVSGAMLRTRAATHSALPHGVTLPSARTLTRFVLAELSRRERVQLAQGHEAVRHTVTPRPGGRRIVEAGRVLIIDHRQGDTRVFWGDRQVRPWWTAAVDAYCGAIRGLVVSPTAHGSDQIALTLLDAILPKPEDPDGILVGLPEALWTDCGMDMMSLRIEAIRTNLKIDRIESRPRTPWERGMIEGSCFATAAKMFEPGLPGYVGNRPRKGSAPVKAVLQLDDYERQLRAWFFTTYNTMTLTRRRHQGMKVSRLDLMRTRPEPPRSAPADELVRALLYRTTRKVTSRGVHLLNHRYWDSALARLAEEQGTVDVLYHPAHLRSILIVVRDQILCVAEDPTEQSPEFALLRQARPQATAAAGAAGLASLSAQIRTLPGARAEDRRARNASAEDRVAADWPDPADTPLPEGF